MGERLCPLCGSVRTAGLFRKGGVDYWRCPECRFRFATPDRNPNVVDALEDYPEAYLQYLGPDAADRTNFDHLYQWMASVTPLERVRLLDVGTGSGKFVRYLRSRGIDAMGIEPSRPLFERFLAGDDAFRCATIDELPYAPHGFSVVTALDVIEHIDDPNRFLGDIVQALDTAGVVFLSTPNVESLTSRLFGHRWHFYYPTHLSYFSPRTLARAAARHRLRIVDCQHRGRWRSMGYVVRYAAEFILGSPAPRWARRFDGWHLPVNLYDTMYLALRRTTAGTTD